MGTHLDEASSILEIRDINQRAIHNNAEPPKSASKFANMNTKTLAFLILGLVVVLVYPNGSNAQRRPNSLPCKKMEENCAKTYGKGTNDYEGCMMGPCTLDRDDSDAEDPDAPRGDALDREECVDATAPEGFEGLYYDCAQRKKDGECDNESAFCKEQGAICNWTQTIGCKATCGTCEA